MDSSARAPVDKGTVEAIIKTLQSWSATQLTVISILNGNRETLASVGAWDRVEEILANTAAHYFEHILPLAFGYSPEVDLASLKTKIMNLAGPYSEFYDKNHGGEEKSGRVN